MTKTLNEAPVFRFGHINDLPAIVNIYNQAIRSGIATGDVDEFQIEDRVPWFQKFDRDTLPIYVVEIQRKVVGYGTLSPYRPGRRAMLSMAEISFFLDEQSQGMGIGSQLVDYMIKDCHRIGKQTLLAILLDINEKSIALLKKFEFEQWGHLPDVVVLKNQTCGQLIFGLKIQQQDLSGSKL